jgi:hypothetical protein
MTSKIKVDNITDQDDNNIINESGDVITVGAAGDTVAVAGNIVKSNTLQASDGGNIVNQSGTTITLGASGDTVSLASGASQTGFGREGSVNWQTSIKTGDFTAVNGEGYFVDTTSAEITVTLPASPSSGSIVAIKDYAYTFDTNKVTLNRNGSNIEGLANNFTIETEGQAVTLVYADATRGWLPVEQAKSGDLDPPALFTAASGGTESTCGNFKIHTFTGPGTFTITQLGNAPANPGGGPSNVDYRVVAGGGNGGTAYYSGGGGAGGHRTSFPSPGCNAGAFPVTATAFPITVGAGGAGVETPCSGSASDINPGSNSIFSSITSAGGGGGTPTNVQDPADAGGSGGGGGGYGCSGGAGNTPPVSPPQGNPGGNGSLTPSGGGGGGGGGAGSAGTNGTSAPNATAGNGGNGLANSITGSSVTLAGGGGAGGFCGPTSNIPGGSGGPGGGGAGNADTGVSGTANTGGGGGAVGGRSPGSPPFQGGSGGSGIVIIRYKFQ